MHRLVDIWRLLPAVSKLTAALQNNLIESASYATGSLLIWDTGEYTVLPRKRVEAETEDEQSDTNKPSISTHAAKPENKKLIEAFQTVRTHLSLPSPLALTPLTALYLPPPSRHSPPKNLHHYTAPPIHKRQPHAESLPIPPQTQTQTRTNSAQILPKPYPGPFFLRHDSATT